MLAIGLTGGTGSGKTEVARILQKKGGIIVSGDQIGRQVVERNPQVLKKLVNAFGKEILNRKGKLNRKKLGSLAFATWKNQRKLNRIVHPPLLKELKRRIKQAKKIESNRKFLVVDAALISEWGLEKDLDVTVLVTSPEEIRLKRLIKQGLSEKEIRDRMNRQLNDAQRLLKADYVIENDLTIKQLERKVLSFHGTVMSLYRLWKRLNVAARFDSKGLRDYIEQTMLKNSQV